MSGWVKFLTGFAVTMSTVAVMGAFGAYADVQKLKGAANISLENQKLLCKMSTRILKDTEDQPLIDEICARDRILFK